MNNRIASLSAPELRDLLIWESKKFNAAIKYRASVSDLEEIQVQIKEIEEVLKQKEIGEIPQSRVESIPPYSTNHRYIA